MGPLVRHETQRHRLVHIWYPNVEVWVLGLECRLGLPVGSRPPRALKAPGHRDQKKDARLHIRTHFFF